MVMRTYVCAPVGSGAARACDPKYPPATAAASRKRPIAIRPSRPSRQLMYRDHSGSTNRLIDLTVPDPVCVTPPAWRAAVTEQVWRSGPMSGATDDAR